jgi:hypothetical protein
MNKLSERINHETYISGIGSKIEEPIIDDERRNLGPITADHHRPQFSSAYLLIKAGGITTEIKEGSNIKAERKSVPTREISSCDTKA